MTQSLPNILGASLLLLSGVHSFAPVVAPKTTAITTTTTQLDASVGIYFGTVGGNTKRCANHIMSAADADNDVTICEIEDLTDPQEFCKHDALIIGAPTWNTGAEKERTLTGWDNWLYYTLPSLDVKEKKVALFGVGDQGDYPFNCKLHSDMDHVQSYLIGALPPIDYIVDHALVCLYYILYCIRFSHAFSYLLTISSRDNRLRCRR